MDTELTWTVPLAFVLILIYAYIRKLANKKSSSCQCDNPFFQSENSENLSENLSENSPEHKCEDTCGKILERIRHVNKLLVQLELKRVRIKLHYDEAIIQQAREEAALESLKANISNIRKDIAALSGMSRCKVYAIRLRIDIAKSETALVGLKKYNVELKKKLNSATEEIKNYKKLIADGRETAGVLRRVLEEHEKYKKYFVVNKAALTKALNDTSVIQKKMVSNQSQQNEHVETYEKSIKNGSTAKDQTLSLKKMRTVVNLQLSNAKQQVKNLKKAKASFKDLNWYGTSMGGNVGGTGAYFSNTSSCPALGPIKPTCGAKPPYCNQCNPHTVGGDLVVYGMGGGSWGSKYQTGYADNKAIYAYPVNKSWDQYTVSRRLLQNSAGTIQATIDDINLSDCGKELWGPEPHGFGAGTPAFIAASGIFVSSSFGDESGFDPDTFLFIGVALKDVGSGSGKVVPVQWMLDKYGPRTSPGYNPSNQPNYRGAFALDPGLIHSLRGDKQKYYSDPAQSGNVHSVVADVELKELTLPVTLKINKSRDGTITSHFYSNYKSTRSAELRQVRNSRDGVQMPLKCDPTIQLRSGVMTYMPPGVRYITKYKNVLSA
jgi:hypothetical protein